MDLLEPIKEAIKVLTYLTEKTLTGELTWVILTEDSRKAVYQLNTSRGSSIIIDSEGYIDIRGACGRRLFFREDCDGDVPINGKILSFVNLIRKVNGEEKAKQERIEEEIETRVGIIFSKLSQNSLELWH